jgi:hypothetical protein
MGTLKTVISVNWAMNGGVTYATPFGVSITRIKPSSLFSGIPSTFPLVSPSVLDISTCYMVAELVPFVEIFPPRIRKKGGGRNLAPTSRTQPPLLYKLDKYMA